MPRMRAVSRPSSSITIRRARTSRSPTLRVASAVWSPAERPFHEVGLVCFGLGSGLLAPSAPRLGAKPVEGRRARDPEQPGAGAAPSGVETRPPAQRLFERRTGEVVRERSVAGQIEQVAEHVVEVALGRVGERRWRLGASRCAGECHRVHDRSTPPGGCCVTRVSSVAPACRAGRRCGRLCSRPGCSRPPGRRATPGRPDARARDHSSSPLGWPRLVELGDVPGKQERGRPVGCDAKLPIRSGSSVEVIECGRRTSQGTPREVDAEDVGDALVAPESRHLPQHPVARREAGPAVGGSWPGGEPGEARAGRSAGPSAPGVGCSERAAQSPSAQTPSTPSTRSRVDAHPATLVQGQVRTQRGEGRP